MPRTLIDDIEHAPTHSMRAVLRIRDFRNLWIGLGLSSSATGWGCWRSRRWPTSRRGTSARCWATPTPTQLQQLRDRRRAVPAGAARAGDGADRRLGRRPARPAVDADLGRLPARGAVPDDPDRRPLCWVFAATVLVEAISLVWGPAKDATVPNLVPRHRLEAANQVSLVTTYGSALPAAFASSAMTLLDQGCAPDHVSTGSPATRSSSRSTSTRSRSSSPASSSSG